MSFLSKYYQVINEQDGIDFEQIRRELSDSIYVFEDDMIIWLKPDVGSFAYYDKSDKEFTFTNKLANQNDPNNGKIWQINFKTPIQRQDSWIKSPDDLMSVSRKGTSHHVAEIYLDMIKKNIEKL